MKEQRMSRGVGLLFNLGATWMWVVNTTAQLLYSRIDPVPSVWEAGWAPGPV